MKEVINKIYWDAKSNLGQMQLSKMSLKDRVKYEKGLAQLEAMKRIIDAVNIEA